MQIFINEVSLQGQYSSEFEFRNAVQSFSSLFALISEKIKDKTLYKNSQILIKYDGIKGSNFQKSLNALKDKSLKTAFVNIVFNKLNPKEWHENQLHSDSDVFIHQIDLMDISGTSIAEAAERSLQNSEVIYLLVNFVNSPFKLSHPQINNCFSIPIIKNYDEINLIRIDCIDDKSGFQNWLEEKLKLSQYEYDNFSIEPPNDKQTILRDTTRFKKTSLRYQERAIYCENFTGRYWYVDNIHTGEAAHIEVFDGRGKHLGEADLYGEINELKRDDNKTINL